MGWLNGWTYRKQVNITGQTGADTLYQIELSIGASAGGDFHLHNHCVNFPQDIRFTDNDGGTLLDYWVEDLTADPITVWVEVADDLGSNQSIYCYYGKSGESSASNGTNTFDFFDDFLGASLDIDKWNTAGTPTVSGGAAHLDGNDEICGKTSFGFGYAIEARSKADEQDITFVGLEKGIGDESEAIVVDNSDVDHPDDFDKIRFRTEHGGVDDIDYNDNWNDFRNIYYIYRILRYSATYLKGQQNSHSYTDDNIHIPTISLYPFFDVWNSSQESTLDIDWVFVRKYNSPEPAFGTAGGETTQHTKTFTADALIQATLTKTFTADVIIVNRNTKTFTADAIIVNRNTKTFTADALIQATLTKTFTANALIQATLTKTFTANALIQATLTKTFTADAIIFGHNTKTFTADVLIEAQNTKTFTADTIIVNRNTKTFTADVLIEAQQTKTFTADVLIKATQTKAFTADVIIVIQETKTFTADVIIVNRNTKTFTADVNIIEYAPIRGFYYSKLGTDNLINPPDPDFNVTIEHNGIASFDFVIQNNAANRTIIADHLTEDFKIMRDDGTEILTGSIDSDRIEYFAEGEGGAGKRIRLSGYASFIDLAYLIYKRMADADAEAIGSVQDEDNSTATFTDYTTQANNDTINDVLLTFGAANDALYMGKAETFFAAKIKYSTKGIQAANTTVVIEYSKGSGVWATFDCIDESYAFTEDAGTYLLYTGNKPDDWAKDTINGKNQYYIRFRITQGSYSTKPKSDRVWLSNADVCRVQFDNVSAKTILGYVLEGMGYSEDATDQCPDIVIPSIRGELDTNLRWIFGIGSALTWEDANGDKQRYDTWIDTSKKVHYKQQRGTDKGDLSGDFRAVNNKMGYHGIGTRIFGKGLGDGINQKTAIVEDTTAQAEHKLREIVLEDSKITGYEALKAETQKSLTIRKAPLKEVSGDIDTKYWLDNSLSVGDKITINQPDWNLNDQELYIMRAVIDPSNTHLDLGTSQMHLEHMRSSLQRQMDINNVWMHGAVSVYIAGPIVDNYQRVDDTTVYPVKMKILIPNDVRAINKVKISWALSNFKSSAKASKSKDLGTKGSNSTDLGAKTSNSRTLNITDHGAITPIAGYTPEHGHVTTYGGYDGITSYAGAHKHGQWTDYYNGYHRHVIAVVTGWEAAHSHPNPTTSGPSATSVAVNNLVVGTACSSGYCINDWPVISVASSTHTHSQGSTGSAGYHAHSISDHTNYAYVNHHHEIWEDGLHQHGVTIKTAGGHTTTINTIDPLGHIADFSPGPEHDHYTDIGSHDHNIVMGSHEHEIEYGVHEEASGTILELIVNGTTVANTYEGDQTDILITGWLSKGTNTVELQPKVGQNYKGRAEIFASVQVFVESK